MSSELYTCPCCGYKTRSETEYGSFEICDVCYWEDDEVQVRNPHMPIGANRVSFRLAQENFKEFGACEIEMKKNVINDRSKYELDTS